MANNYEEVKWYYLSLQKIFNDRLDNNVLLNRYNDIVNEYFN